MSSRTPTGTDFGELKDEIRNRAPKEDFQRQEARLEAMAREVRMLDSMRTEQDHQRRMLEGALNMLADIKENKLAAQNERISAVKDTVSRLMWMGGGIAAVLSVAFAVFSLWLNHH